MRWSVVLGNLGTLLKLFPVTLLPPIVVAFLMEPGDASLLGVAVPRSVVAFVATGVVCLLLGLALERIGHTADFREPESYLLVGLGWLVLTCVAASPFLIAGVLTDPADAFYEAMSGFTTTGYSAITVPLEDVAPSIHFWRAETQWLGGMGIIVLSVAIFRSLATSGARLMRAEIPGGDVMRLRPRIASTATALWTVYAGVTAALIVVMVPTFMRGAGLSFGRALYESFIHVFAGLATGGFSSRTASVEAFGSPGVEWALVFVMVCGGVNFALYFHVFRGRPLRLWRDEEFRFFLSVLALAAAAVTVALATSPASDPFWDELGGKDATDALRVATFQVVSSAGGVGFTTAHYDLWPATAGFLLLFLMFVGGCVGSTTGAIKMVRALLSFKLVRAELTRMGHPRAVVPVRLGHEIVDNDTFRRLAAFLFLYITAFIAGTLWTLTFTDFSVVDAASFSAGSLGNVGASFGGIGPDFTYGTLPNTVMMGSAALMMLGRFEVIGVLVLFARRTYG